MEEEGRTEARAQWQSTLFITGPLPCIGKHKDIVIISFFMDEIFSFDHYIDEIYLLENISSLKNF